jgi:hypothetical protein
MPFISEWFTPPLTETNFFILILGMRTMLGYVSCLPSEGRQAKDCDIRRKLFLKISS